MKNLKLEAVIVAVGIALLGLFTYLGLKSVAGRDRVVSVRGLAEREVNSYLTLIKQQNIRNWTDQDYLSMTALKFAIANVGMRQSRELDSEDLRRLEAIGEEIDSCLNDPTR